MEPTNDSTFYTVMQDKNVSLSEEKETLRHKFTKVGETIFIAISKDIAARLNLTDETWVQEIADGNCIRLVLTK